MSHAILCDACGARISDYSSQHLTFTISFESKEGENCVYDSGDVCSKTCALTVIAGAADRIKETRI
jgi:hypothetical protein